MTLLAVLLLLALTGVGLLLWGWIDTRRFSVTETEIALARLPRAFEGYTLLQVSDLHNNVYGRDKQALLRALDGLSYDCIAVTGDLFDHQRPKEKNNAYAFAQKAVGRGPVYFIEGNHEEEIKEYPVYRKKLISLGACVLDNERVLIKRGEDCLNLIGVKNSAGLKEMKALTDKEAFNLLLSHRPDKAEMYRQCGADLVLTGHAHGGQVRLWGRGLYAPDQGVLPKYTAGLYALGDTVLFVSRGAGNHNRVPRVFNRPEINLIRLRCKKQ